MENPFSILVIGGSAGAIDALREILPHLPENPSHRRFAIVCVLHLLPKGQSLLPAIFKDRCPWRVKEAESTELIEAGTVYFAPADYHLSVEADRSFALSNEEPVMFSRPSIDLFFTAAAKVYGRELVALLLSGANGDGARGFREILARGGRCLVQAPETAEFPEMPRAGAAVSASVLTMKPLEIIDFLDGRPRD